MDDGINKVRQWIAYMNNMNDMNKTDDVYGRIAQMHDINWCELDSTNEPNKVNDWFQPMILMKHTWMDVMHDMNQHSQTNEQARMTTDIRWNEQRNAWTNGCTREWMIGWEHTHRDKQTNR